MCALVERTALLVAQCLPVDAPLARNSFKISLARRRTVRCCVSKPGSIAGVGAPDSFDHKRIIKESSSQIISARFPELQDLAQKGVLAAVERPADYIERRADGYQEPELVLVVGTAHFSVESARDVERVVEAVRPENVVLEICRSRTGVMYDESQQAAQSSGNGKVPNALSLSGPGFLQSVFRSARLGGNSAMLMRAVLAGQVDRVSQTLGARSGVEMRAASRAAGIVGAQIVLGDRPIEITLQRAWDALSWRKRLQLLWLLLRSRGGAADISAADVEAMKDDDVITAAVKDFSSTLPEVVGPLLHERDMYLAWSLKRSKAVNGTKRVVGVIGKGHMRGVLYHLTSPEASRELRFRDLVGGKIVRQSRQQQTARILKRLALEAGAAVALYLAWAQLFPAGS